MYVFVYLFVCIDLERTQTVIAFPFSLINHIEMGANVILDFKFIEIGESNLDGNLWFSNFVLSHVTHIYRMVF